MKKKIFTILSLIAIILSVLVVNAEEQVEKSYITMPGGSTLTGSTRTYKFKKHKIDIYPTKLGCLTGEINGSNRLYVGLEKKGILSYSDKGHYKFEAINKLGEKYSHDFGSQGKGKFRYIFNTGTSFDWYGSIDANPVYMYSYE